MKILPISVVTLGLLIQSASAQISLSNFEDNSTDGWQNWGGNAYSVVAAPTASLGSYSLQLTISNQYWGQYVLPNWANSGVSVANLNANPQFSLDLYFPSSGWLANYADVNVQWQTGGGTLGNQDGTISTHLSSITFDTAMHLTIDLSTLMPRDTTATWGNLILFVQPGWVPTYTPYTVYLDNVEIAPVPEPATATLLGLGTLCGIFVIRRRRS